MPNQVGRVWSEKDIPTWRLDEYMALCFQSEQHQLGIEEYEKFHGNVEPSLKKVLKPRELGYVLCLHKTLGRFDPCAALRRSQDAALTLRREVAGYRSKH